MIYEFKCPEHGRWEASYSSKDPDWPPQSHPCEKCGADMPRVPSRFSFGFEDQMEYGFDEQLAMPVRSKAQKKSEMARLGDELGMSLELVDRSPAERIAHHQEQAVTFNKSGLKDHSITREEY